MTRQERIRSAFSKRNANISKLVSISGKTDGGDAPIFTGANANPIITGFIFHEGLEEIGDCAFVGCSSLTLLTGIPQSCTKLGKKSFAGTGISTLAGISSDTNNIGEGAFNGCISLTTVQGASISGAYVSGLESCNVTTIEANTFNDCSIATIVGLPPSVKKLGKNAFGGNAHIQSIRLDYSGDGIVEASSENDPFADSLVKANVKVAVPAYKLEAYNADTYWKDFNLVPGEFTIVATIASAQVTVSGNGYLQCSEGTESITIEWGDGTTTVVAVGGQSRAYILNISHQYAEANTYYIAFTGAIEGIYAFEGSILQFSDAESNITNFFCSSISAKLGDYCFANTNIRSLAGMGDAVIELGAYAFSQCIDLTSLDGASQTLAQIGAHCFSASALTNISALTNTLVSELPGYSFYQCSSLASLNGLSKVDTYHSDGHTFEECTGLTSLAGMSASIEQLPVSCFRGCIGLTTLEGMPNTVNSIGAYCFAECSGLSSMNALSSAISALPEQAFSGCTNLTKVTLQSNVTSIGNNCFAGCPNIAIISIKNTASIVTTPSNNDPFSGISDKTSVYLSVPSSLIDAYEADSYWSQFNIVQLPSFTIAVESTNATLVGAGYLETANSGDFVHIDMGNGNDYDLQSDADCRIDLSSALAQQTYASAGQYTITLDGDIVGIGGDTSLSGSAIFVSPNNGAKITSVYLPPNVVTIGDYCFKGTAVSSLVSLLGATSFGAHCFEDCASLTSLEGMPTTVASLGDYCFCGSGLTSLNGLPEANLTLGAHCFDGVAIESTLGLPSALLTIPTACFANCTSLRYLVLPNSNVQLGASAFSGCSELLVVRIDGSTKLSLPSDIDPFFGISDADRGRITVVVNSSLSSAYKSDSYWQKFTFRQGCLFEIDPQQYEGSSFIEFNGEINLKWIESEDSGENVKHRGMVIDWGDGSFTSFIGGSGDHIVTNLISHSYNDTQRHIPIYFYGDIERFYNPNYISLIRFIAGTAPVVRIVLDEGVQQLGSNLFARSLKWRDTSGTTIELPSTLDTDSVSNPMPIGANCFYECTSLTSIDISRTNISQLAESTFFGCTSLTSVGTLPSTLEVIGASCFEGCSSLASINFSTSNVYSLGNRCFSGAGLTSLRGLPSGLQQIGSECFANCASLASIADIPTTYIFSIPASCFSGCSALAPTLVIPNGISNLGNRCFAGISQIHSIGLGYNGVVSATIENDPFYGLTTEQKGAIKVGVPSAYISDYQNNIYWSDFAISSLETTFTISTTDSGAVLKGGGYLKADYNGTATIDWGDGSAPATVSLVANEPVWLTSLAHTYAESGNYVITIEDPIIEVGGYYDGVGAPPSKSEGKALFYSDSGDAKISDFSSGSESLGLATVASLILACRR